MFLKCDPFPGENRAFHLRPFYLFTVKPLGFTTWPQSHFYTSKIIFKHFIYLFFLISFFPDGNRILILSKMYCIICWKKSLFSESKQKKIKNSPQTNKMLTQRKFNQQKSKIQKKKKNLLTSSWFIFLPILKRKEKLGIKKPCRKQ